MDLTHLDSDMIGNNGEELTEFIRVQGEDPLLKHVDLSSVSIPGPKWFKLFDFLSTCYYISTLDLRECCIGAAGHHLAESIRSWWYDPPLETLNLYKCSIPEEAWSDILKSLATCKHIKVLNLSHNDIGAAGHHLAQSIRSWGYDPPLEMLDLCGCSIPNGMWHDILAFIATCKNIKVLNLGDNRIRLEGHDLAQSIRSWGYDPPLERLLYQSASVLYQRKHVA